MDILKHTEREITNSGYERCVLCNKMTAVPQNLNIDLRQGYIEGAGQLCKQCFCELAVRAPGD